MNLKFPSDAWQPGTECLILSLGEEKAVFQRLAQMGVLPGSRLRVIHISPFKGTLEVSTGQGQPFALGEQEMSSLDCELTAMPLTLTAEKQNRAWRIRQLNGGRVFQQRMKDLKLLPGALIKVLFTDHGGMTVRIIKDQSSIDLGTGEAKKIIVEPGDDR